MAKRHWSAEAWDAWLNSEEGIRSQDPVTIGADPAQAIYLENRLNLAFHAGIAAADLSAAVEHMMRRGYEVAFKPVSTGIRVSIHRSPSRRLLAERVWRDQHTAFVLAAAAIGRENWPLPELVRGMIKAHEAAGVPA